MMQADCKRKGRSNYSTTVQRFSYFIGHDSEGGEKLGVGTNTSWFMMAWAFFPVRKLTNLGAGSLRSCKQTLYKLHRPKYTLKGLVRGMHSTELMTEILTCCHIHKTQKTQANSK